MRILPQTPENSSHLAQGLALRLAKEQSTLVRAFSIVPVPHVVDGNENRFNSRVSRASHGTCLLGARLIRSIKIHPMILPIAWLRMATVIAKLSTAIVPLQVRRAISATGTLLLFPPAL